MVGGYVHRDDKIEWNSIKEEIKAIREAYLNPMIVVAGDFNEAFSKMFKLG